MAIDPVVFPTDLSRGATGGPMFSTIIIGTATSSEQRIAQWSLGRRKWDVSHAMQDIATAALLLAFFINRQGRARGFLFQDPLDNTIPASSPQLMGDITTFTGGGTFQLQEIYSTGGITTNRPITRPDPTSIIVYNTYPSLTVLSSSDYTVDDTTGIVSIATGVLGPMAASFDFYVPARFDIDEMKLQHEDEAVRSWDQIPIIEIPNETS